MILFGLLALLNMVLPHHFPELTGSWDTSGPGIFIRRVSPIVGKEHRF